MSGRNLAILNTKYTKLVIKINFKDNIPQIHHERQFNSEYKSKYFQLLLSVKNKNYCDIFFLKASDFLWNKKEKFLN